MRKKIGIIIAMIVMCSLIFGCANTSEPEKEEASGGEKTEKSETMEETPKEELMDSLEKLRARMAEKPHIAAISFMGCCDGSYADVMRYLGKEGYIESYPFMADITEERFIELAGSELYCLVPLDANASVAVNEWVIDETNDFQGGTGEVKYRSDSGEPVIVRGNISDIMPNIQMVIVDEIGQILDYTPYISLKDGSIVLPDEEPYVMEFGHTSKE